MAQDLTDLERSDPRRQAERTATNLPKHTQTMHATHAAMLARPPTGTSPGVLTDLPLADFSIDEIYGRLMDNGEEDKKIEAMLHEVASKKPRKTNCS